MESSWLTREQAADYLGLAKQTLDNWASQKRGPPYYRIGRNARYLHSDLEQWMIEQKRNANLR